MAVTVQKFDPKIAMIVPQQKLWLTEDKSRLVADGDPAAAFLFCIPGRAISKAEAAQYGLLEEPKAVEPPRPDPVPPQEPVETKEIVPQPRRNRR